MDAEGRRLRSTSDVKTSAEMPGDAAKRTTEKKPKKEVKVKFPCGNCSKTTSGCASLLCNICEHWHHKECIPGMTDSGYQTLVSMKESMGCVFFLCSKCEKVHKKTWQAVNQLSKRVDSIEKRMDEMEKQLKINTEKQSETISKVKAVENKSAISSNSVQSSVLNEIQQQDARKTNIVIYNLVESPNKEGSARKDHDITQLRSILETIGLADDINIESDVSTSRRLGKHPVATAQTTSMDSQPEVATLAPTSKPRPLLVSFKAPHLRRDILANARKLSKSNFKHISVCPDLTKTQQKEDKQLRDEVAQLNTEKPLDDKGPFLWKVVGVPGQSNRRKVKIYERDPNIAP